MEGQKERAQGRRSNEVPSAYNNTPLVTWEIWPIQFRKSYRLGAPSVTQLTKAMELLRTYLCGGSDQSIDRTPWPVRRAVLLIEEAVFTLRRSQSVKHVRKE